MLVLSVKSLSDFLKFHCQHGDEQFKCLFFPISILSHFKMLKVIKRELKIITSRLLELIIKTQANIVFLDFIRNKKCEF